MKKNILFFLFSACILAGSCCFAQVSKAKADSGKVLLVGAETELTIQLSLDQLQTLETLQSMQSMQSMQSLKSKKSECAIVSFNFSKTSSNGNVTTSVAHGNKINAEMKSLLKNAKPGDRFYFGEIKVNCKGSRGDQGSQGSQGSQGTVERVNGVGIEIK